MHFDNSYVLSDQRLQPLKAFAFFGLILSVTIFTYSHGWSGGWHFDDAPARLSAKKVYTICLTAQDGGSFDLSPDAKEVTLSIVLAR